MDMEKVTKGLESLRDICNAKSNMSIGNGKIAWAGYANVAEDAIALLKEQPEIVRCKNCKHFEPDGIYTMCYMHNGLSQNADWFCADGERKEG